MSKKAKLVIVMDSVSSKAVASSLNVVFVSCMVGENQIITVDAKELHEKEDTSKFYDVQCFMDPTGTVGIQDEHMLHDGKYKKLILEDDIMYLGEEVVLSEAIKSSLYTAQHLTAENNTEVITQKMKDYIDGYKDVDIRGFPYSGIYITDSKMDETARFKVIPELYYGDVYNDWMIKKNTVLFDKQLVEMGLSVSIWQTDESYGEGDDSIEEKDEYFGKPMFEGIIVDASGDDVDDTNTGRFCCLKSVCDELEGYVEEQKAL